MQPSTKINRKNTVGDTYFDKIDTQEKAYWLGFLWADGSISKTAKRASGPNRLRITQKWSEKAHLEKFRDALSSDYEIDRAKSRSPYGDPPAQLDINCRPLCESLKRLGYGTKDVRIHIPKIPKNLMRHFIRGYFDGDGCLSVYTQQMRQYTILKQEWSITGKEPLLEEIKAVLSRDAGTTPTVSMKPYKRSPGTKSLRYGKKSGHLCASRISVQRCDCLS